MSVEILSSQVDSIRAEAARTSASYTSQARSIDADTSLSAEGKAAAKVEVNANAKEQLRALRQKENDAINMKVRDLEKQLDSKMGSTASDIIAFRDAQDRAERFEKPEDAVRALERAIRTEDTTLAHAIFRRGIESGWRDVIATFGNEYPDKKPIVGDLAYLREAQTNTLGRGMNYMWIAQ